MTNKTGTKSSQPPSRAESRAASKKSSLGIAPLGKLKTILRAKANKVSVIYQGRNLTPKPLDPQVYTYGKERQISIYNISQDAVSSSPRSSDPSDYKRSSLKFKPDYGGDAQIKGSILGVASYDLTDLAETSSTSDGDSTTDLSVPDLATEDQVLTTDMKAIPTHVSLVLNETSTFFVLDLPSSTELKNTDEGNLVEELNKDYEYLTHGKGRNRRVGTVAVQTMPILRKSRNTIPEQIKIKNDVSFASNWDMYDTYTEKDERAANESDESNESTSEVHQLDDLASVESFKLSGEEKQSLKLMKNTKFLEAVCVIERLLANNDYNEQQKRFRGLSDPDDLRDNIEYKYRLNLLWTFSNENTKARCVTSLEWNPSNEDILAVGYGKFYFTENKTGMVMIWNIKNPVQPERQYSFKHSVTTLAFSRKDPNLLAVGFYEGYILVLDVFNREKHILTETTPCYEPVWYILWKPNPDKTINTEDMWSASDDGRVWLYSMQAEVQRQQLMRVAKADGKLKGYDPMRKCSNLNIPVSRYVSARFIEPHPKECTNYYVGTNEGVIHKCSSNYLNQHLDLFLAHDGPVNAMKHSPFSSKIFATCGDDWYIRLWAEGIAEPLHELFVTMQSVQDIAWSPTHSTILASIYGKTILLWDLQRKVYEPQSVTESPTNCRNTVVQFIASGRCLVVGDIDGNVHVFSLEDMPFPAFFQESLLFESFFRSLITKPNLLYKLRKVRRKEGSKGEVM